MPFTPAREAQIVNLIRRAARTEILPRFRALSEAEVTAKSGPDDLVTQADTAAEAMIARGLGALFPGALIVGEEAAEADRSLPDRIAEAELCFIVDPVDGTWNFARGLPLFGVILAACRFGEPVWAMIHDPVCDDWISAAEDRPTRLERPGRPHRPLRMGPAREIAEMSGFVPLSLVPEDRRPAVAALFPEFRRATSLRCSAHEYRLLAQGHADFCLGVDPKPWDHAAGVLLCRQAGGYAAFLDGAPYTAARREGYLLTAASPDCWARLAERFGPVAV
ncbi:inositol monophosphatase family protein [Rhodosalinus sp.]|uniref:inositol monophosphatase family protein n=1 Tax=Rhodosalinus sp. TaxID=2047741 RepID=UPI0039781924